MEPGQTVSLTFTSAFDIKPDVCLLELTEEMLTDLLNGSPMYFKGGKDEELVLCTDSATYQVRQADTSDSLLLLPPSGSAVLATNSIDSMDANSETLEPRPRVFVHAIATSHLELTQTRPALHILRAALSEKLFSGHEDDAEDDTEAAEVESARPRRRGCRLRELEDIIASSRGELLDGLASIGAVCINDHWRLLEPQYARNVMDLILASAAAAGWPLEAIPLDECLAALPDHDPVVVQHVLASHSPLGRPVPPSEGDGAMDVETNGSAGSLKYAMDARKICLFSADQLLDLAEQKQWRYAEFMQTWKDSVPDGMSELASEELLAGRALVVTDGAERYIKQFLPDRLSPDVRKRLAELFAVRPRWTLDEISPYLRDILPPKTTMEQLLLKYARGSVPAGSAPGTPKVYTARQ